jgi:CRISPR-associated protein Cmr1
MDPQIFTLETVTPLFMAGADPRGSPELRAPSLRGALRYWLRAALGGALGDDDEAIEQLHQREAAVFGSTDGASPVVLRIPGEPSRTELYRPSRSGRDYLYWSMAGEQGKGTPPRSLVPVGERFDLELIPRPVPRGDPATADLALRRAVAALWLLVQLGGVGARSRRTAGSISVVSPDAVGDLSFSLKAADPRSAARELADGLRLVRSLFADPDGGVPSSPARFDILHPASCRVWVLGEWPTWERAADALGTALREARRRVPLEGRPAFGLPIQGVEKGVDRRASPLWLKLSRKRDSGCFAVATLFYSALLPDSDPSKEDGLGLSPVESFIRQFKAEEVRYG